MVEPTSKPPISQALSEAFRDAIDQYEIVGPALDDEFLVSLDGKRCTIDEVCRRVMEFRDPMPELHQQMLCQLRGGNYDLGDQSYGSGARYLLDLKKARKAAYLRKRQRQS
jgi:hypothetical protein